MITAILSGILGTIGLSGLGLYGLTFLGIGGGLVTWFAAKRIPWRLIFISALALFIGLLVFGAYETFRENQRQLLQTRVELTQEKTAHAAEKARADDYLIQHNADIARVEQLENNRSQIEEQVSLLQAQIDEINQQDFDHDTVKATADLNARNRELSRLLNNASRGTAGHISGPSQHGAAKGRHSGKTFSLKALF